jgi:hypothetical protein
MSSHQLLYLLCRNRNTNLDQSVELTDDDPNATDYHGSLIQLKESHNGKGNILNALDLSMPVGNEPPHGILADREAFGAL